MSPEFNFLCKKQLEFQWSAKISRGVGIAHLGASAFFGYMSYKSGIEGNQFGVAMDAVFSAGEIGASIATFHSARQYSDRARIYEAAIVQNHLPELIATQSESTSTVLPVTQR